MLGVSINEKRRDVENAAPDPDLALSLSTAFGLNHYPNYLYRFREGSEELTRMENLLQQQLEKVQKQRREIVAMNEMKSNFLALYPVNSTPSSSIQLDVYSLRFWLNPTLFKTLGCPPDISIEDFISSKPSATIQEAFAEELDIEGGMDGIFSIQLFTKEACEYLIEKTKCFAQYIHTYSEGSLMMEFKRRPPPLFYMGLEFLDQLLLYIVNIIAPLVFPEYVNHSALDWSHGYVVGYSDAAKATEVAVQRSGLITHTDDSEVTCNLALNDNYQGGELVMGGLRGDDDVDEMKLKIKKSIGTLILHAGRRLHEVAPVQKGTRFHLICWTRNLAGVRSRVCPCCWMNNRRRQRVMDGYIDDCICGEWWN